MAADTHSLLSERPWLRFYEPEIPPSLSYPSLTLGEMLAQSARLHPERTALIFFGKRLTYREIDRLANKFARSLLRLGITRGDRVALMLPNIPQMVIAYYGTLRTGAIAVPTNPLYLEHELEVQLKDSGATALVAVDMFYPVVSRAFSKTPVKHVILCGIRDYLPFPLNLLYPLKARREKQWVSVKRVPPLHDFIGLIAKESGEDPAVPIGQEDIALLQYTGG
ncbi:MAG TPA: AMP-binding protein, partial [Nitrospirota bacterium]|nr:AMP-binding protein [Nitrospirota bacterium]